MKSTGATDGLFPADLTRRRSPVISAVIRLKNVANSDLPMPQFNEHLLTLLSELDPQTIVDGFIAGDAAFFVVARNSYNDLVNIAYDHEKTEVRKNAFWLIRYLGQPDAMTVLNDMRIADTDPEIQAVAAELQAGLMADRSIEDAKAHPGGVAAYIRERCAKEAPDLLADHDSG